MRKLYLLYSISGCKIEIFHCNYNDYTVKQLNIYYNT